MLGFCFKPEGGRLNEGCLSTFKQRPMARSVGFKGRFGRPPKGAALNIGTTGDCQLSPLAKSHAGFGLRENQHMPQLQEPYLSSCQHGGWLVFFLGEEGEGEGEKVQPTHLPQQKTENRKQKTTTSPQTGSTHSPPPTENRKQKTENHHLPPNRFPLREGLGTRPHRQATAWAAAWPPWRRWRWRWRAWSWRGWRPSGRPGWGTWPSRLGAGGSRAGGGGAPEGVGDFLGCGAWAGREVEGKGSGGQWSQEGG